MSELGFFDDDEEGELGDRRGDALEISRGASVSMVLRPVRPRWWWSLTPWRKRCDHCGHALTREGRVWRCPTDGYWHEAPSCAPNGWRRRRRARKWLAQRHGL